MVDLMVKKVQQWLNDTFPSYFRYDEEDETNCGSYPIKPDGYTGTKTVKALVMAIQIHYNLTPVDGIWGNATSAACPEIKLGVTDSTLIKIAQGGFYCKGYNPGGFDGILGNGLASAIANFKADLGITSSQIMEQDVFKALLTMDPTVLVSTGSNMIRTVQKYLNGNYYDLYKSKLGYIPTGGIYERKTSKALIYAFQKEIGTSPDGAIGPDTFRLMPSIEQGCSNTALVRILQSALICNGYPVDSLNGIYDTSLTEKVAAFQQFMCLHNDPSVVVGKTNRRTWGALLWSKGDTERIPNACDCWQRLDYAKASSLYNNGYRYVGRYLTKVENGLDKNMTPSEIVDVLSAGLKMFPIFQESNDSIDDFSFLTGYAHGYTAILTATDLTLPPETTIYFSVDYDAMEDQTKSVITEYFKGIKKAQEHIGSTYKIGIYSARNTCSIICDQNLATSSFVSDMSSGYSGNLGYLLPSNWAFDQYKTYVYTASDNSTFDLDCLIASDNAKYFDHAVTIENDFWDAHKFNIGLNALEAYTSHATSISSLIPFIKKMEDAYWEYNESGTPLDCALSVLYCLWIDKYQNDSLFKNLLYLDKDFLLHLQNSNNEGLNSISNYIKGNYSYLKDNSSIIDVLDDQEYTYSGIFELPHLASTISAYLKTNLSLAKREWFGWAGDMATGIMEVTLILTNHPESTPIEHARDRICKMEVLENNLGLTPTYEVQMNYCDIIADMDAIGIATLINRNLVENSNSHNALSNALTQYYDKYYKQRYSYWLNELKPASYSIDGIKESLIQYFNDIRNIALVELKIGTLNQDALEASSRSLAEFISHARKDQI